MNSTEVSKNDPPPNTQDEVKGEESDQPKENAHSKKKKAPSPKRQASDDDLGMLDPDLEAYIGGDGAMALELAEEIKQEDAEEEEDEEEEEEEEDYEESDDASMTAPSEEFKWESGSDVGEHDNQGAETEEQVDTIQVKVRRGVRLERDVYRQLCKALGITPIRRFMESLRKECIDFSHYRLNSKDVIAMCKVLEDNTHVTWLSFEGNPLGDEGGEAVAKLIMTNYCLTYLNIAATEIAGVIALIFWVLPRNVNLEVLDVSKNNLEDDEMYSISEYLASSVTLRELNLSRNHIGDAGVRALAEGLKTNGALEILDLSWNKIRGNKRATPFFNAAAEMRTLRVLNLGHNYFLDKAANGISRILSMSKTIENLDISLGRLSESSGPIISRGVKKNKTLRNLNLELQNWHQKEVVGIVGASTNMESKLESMNFGRLFDVHKQFLTAESKALKVHPDLKIQRGQPFGLYKAKGPDPLLLVMHRANVVCKNFGTPLRMLIDELRKEEKILTQKKFKKFIKQCNLYKDKVMTESLMRNFAHGSFDVNCEAIIEAYDKAFPLINDPNDPLQRYWPTSKTASKTEGSAVPQA